MYKRSGGAFNALTDEGVTPYLYSEATGKTTADAPLVTLEGRAADPQSPAPLAYIDGAFDKAEAKGHTVTAVCRNLNETVWKARGTGKVLVAASEGGRTLYFPLPRDMARTETCAVSVTLPEEWKSCVLCFSLKGIPFGERMRVALE